MSQKSPVIISVTGAYSGAGKTSLCSLLLTELDEFGAIKFTKTELYSSVSESITILDQKGKDTSSMIHAGAKKVVWVKSLEENLRSALGMALEMFSGVRGIIVEGNSPVDFLNPHLVIFIMGRDGVMKPSARDVIR
jgi:molybdopterin-guanine dinucleotide biosynthesis protein